MTNRHGKKFRNKGFLDPQSSSRVIEKRSMKGNRQRIPADPIDAHAPAYQKVPAYATVLASTGYWATVQGESVPCFDQGPGYIFMCNGKTKADCYRYRVFGLPPSRMDILEKIKPCMKLFLFDLDLKLLYGVYVAASNGKLAIEPAAFGGKFSAQVRFEIFKDCLPLPESAFKHAIPDNYRGGSKFRQELNNEQVANLISLFRPIAEPSSGTASSLMRNTIQPVTITPRSIEMRTQPTAEISASYNQYLARLQPTHDRTAYFRHGRGAPHAPTANMAFLQPVLASQPLFDPFYQPDAHRANFSEKSALYSRYTVMPDDIERVIVQQSGPTKNYDKHETVLGNPTALVQAHAQFSTLEHGHENLPSSSRTAAYWVQVASADPKQVYSSPYKWVPPVSTGLGGQSIPVSIAGVAPAYPAVKESRDRETVQQSSDINDYSHNIVLAAINVHAPTDSVMPLHFQAPSDRSAHLPSSSSAAFYWAAPVSQDPAHVYTGINQGQPSGCTGSGDGEIVQQSSNVSGYNHSIALAATSVHAPTESVMPLNFQAPSDPSAHFPSSTSAAVYWAAPPAHVYIGPDQGLPSGGTGFGGTAPIHAAAPKKTLMENVLQWGYPYGYHQDIAVSSANVSFQAHGQLPSQIPAHLHGSAHSQFSSGAACYWMGVACENTSQVYMDPHRLSSGNSAAYNHNVIVSATNALLQPPAYVPSHVPADSHDPSSSQVDAHGKAMNFEDPNQANSSSHQMPSS